MTLRPDPATRGSLILLGVLLGWGLVVWWVGREKKLWD